jgi:hypothetical protein
MSPWHTLFAALACPDALAAALRTVLAVGHTSGADALAGFIASCYWQTSAGIAKQKLLHSQISPARRSPKNRYFFGALADAPRWAEPNLTEANASSTVKRGK